MKIGDRQIGDNHPPLIIAEIGINHGGCIEIAKQMAHEVALAGGEIIKHQTHFIEDEMTDEAKNVIPPNDHRSIWEIMEECALSPEEEIQWMLREVEKYLSNDNNAIHCPSCMRLHSSGEIGLL